MPEILILAHFLYKLCQTKMGLWQFSKFGPFNMIYSSRDMETFETSFYKTTHLPPLPEKKKQKTLWVV